MMEHHSHDADTRMGGGGSRRDDTGNNGKPVMLRHVISLLQALVSILDIISGSSENRK